MFLAVEGVDGAGKGTVVAALAERLQGLGKDVLVTREPGGTAGGQVLRQLLLSTAATNWDAWAELLLMTAARVQHVREVIRPALDAGRIVVTDRFVGSTIAYQGAGRGLPVDVIELLHREACQDLWPALTIVLDIDPAVGLRRSIRRLREQDVDEGRFETLDLAFHERVRASLLGQARDSGRRHAVFDGAQPAADVAAAVSKAVLELLRESGSL